MSGQAEPPRRPSEVERAWIRHQLHTVNLTPLKEQIKMMIRKSTLSQALPQLEGYWNVVAQGTTDRVSVVVLLTDARASLVADHGRTDELKDLFEDLRIDVPKVASGYNLVVQENGTGPIVSVVNNIGIKSGYAWQFTWISP